MTTRHARICVGIDAGDDHTGRWRWTPGRPGSILGADFVAARHFASHASLASVPRDSGRRTSNYHRPERFNRRLRRLFYTSAQSAMMRPHPSRDHFKKRA